jgi:hypothetical protein
VKEGYFPSAIDNIFDDDADEKLFRGYGGSVGCEGHWVNPTATH